MKIALYIPCLNDKPAGLGIFVNSLISAFQDKNIEIILFTEEKPSFDELGFDELKTKYIEIIPKIMKRSFRLIKKIYRLLWINIALSRILERERIKIFISATFEAPLLTSQKVKYGVIIHDLTALFYSGSDFLLERIYLNLYLQKCLRKSSYIFVPSNSTALIVNKKYPDIRLEKFDVISEGFEHEVFHCPTEEEKSIVKKIYGLPNKYFLYSGSLLRHKNLIIVLKAMQSIKLSHPDCQLLIIGPASKIEQRRMEITTDNLGVSENVRIMGYLPRNHLRALMHCSNAFVFPSMSEGFGLSVLEAMASGSYVICSNSTSLPEVLGNSGELISPYNEIAWIKSMKNALNDDYILNKCKQKRKEAIERATLFSWQITVENILEKINYD